MHLESLNYDVLVSKGINRKFAEILSNPKEFHEDLTIHVSEISWDYFIPDNVTDVVPLWGQNANCYVRWLRNGKEEYVLLFHDDPEWSLVATSEQGIMAVLWSSWAEFQENDSDICIFANALGFKYCFEALQEWETDYDQFQEWMLNLKE